MKISYPVATGSITGTQIIVEHTVYPAPVYPDNDGNLYYYDDDGHMVIVEE